MLAVSAVAAVGVQGASLAQVEDVSKRLKLQTTAAIVFDIVIPAISVLSALILVHGDANADSAGKEIESMSNHSDRGCLQDLSEIGEAP